MKALGWILLIVGVVSAAGAWSYGYGLVGAVTMLIVAAIGAWLVFFKKDGGSMPM